MGGGGGGGFAASVCKFCFNLSSHVRSLGQAVCQENDWSSLSSEVSLAIAGIVPSTHGLRRCPAAVCPCMQKSMGTPIHMLRCSEATIHKTWASAAGVPVRLRSVDVLVAEIADLP